MDRHARAGWTAAAAAAVLVASLAAVPVLRHDGRDVLLPGSSEPTAGSSPDASASPAGEDWLTAGADAARICRTRYGRCLEVVDRRRLEDLTERFNAADPAANACGGGEPDLVILRFRYSDGREERISVNLDCGPGTASAAGKKGRALDPELRDAVLGAAPADYGDPATLAEAYGTAPAYPGRPWQKDGVDVPSLELAAAALPSHCDWQAATFLGGSALDRRQFIRDPDGALDFRPELKEGYRSGGRLPVDARATGYSSGRFELWLAASDPDAAWLVNASERSDTERWPAPAEQLACA